MAQPVTLTREQTAALAALPPWAGRQARAAALGWTHRPLTPGEYEHIEPSPSTPSVTERVHAKEPRLVKLWSAVEAAQARHDDATAVWAEAVAAVRRAELQSNAPEPFRPARVNIAEWMSGRRQPPELRTLMRAEQDALDERNRLGELLVKARQTYAQALTVAARAHGIL